MKRMLIAITLACVISGTALAGDMPIVNRSAMGEMPIVNRSAVGEMPTVPGETPGVPGEMPGVDESLVTTALLTLITTLLGR